MVTVLIPIYKRIELAKMCVSRLVEQGQRLGFSVALVGSEDDLSNFEDVCKFVYEDNTVSDKLNFAINQLRKSQKVIIWGSDNFASDDVFERLIRSKSDIAGFDKVYFYSTHTGKSSLFIPDNKMSLGVGRTYSKKALEALNYEVYSSGKDKGLDTDAFNRYSGKVKETVLKLGKGWILDVKHEMNITSHEIVNMGQEIEPVWDIDFSHLEPKDLPNVPKKSNRQRVTVTIIQNTHGMKVGDTRTVNQILAAELIKMGIAK
jgi:hypothetical protein